MYAGKCPNAKKQFDLNWFELIHNKFPPTNFPDQKFFFLMTISYYGFLNISEVTNLKKSNLIYDSEKEILKI